MSNDNKLIFIKTTRYSALIKSIFEEYNKDIDIFIEGQHYSASNIPQIIESWCKNDKIKATIDFNIVRDGTELFGFHDTPDNFWASVSEQQFLEKLAKEKIIRYVKTPAQKNRPHWFFIAGVLIVGFILVAVFVIIGLAGSHFLAP